MTATIRCGDAQSYELRIDGHLDDHWSSWLDDLVLARHEDGTTTLSGPIADQAQLHGLLGRVRDIGATLLAVHAVGYPTPSEGSHAAASHEPVLARPLQTERLTLRSATGQDAETTFAYRRLESVAQWLTELPTDLESYRTTFAEPARLAATIMVELDGAVIGDFMVRIEDAWAQKEVASQATGKQAELGWVLDPAYTGRGYATEAARELLRAAFEDLGVRRVVANAFADNDASCRLMGRVGMRRETHALRVSLHRSGHWLDTVAYALRADEWTEAQLRLRPGRGMISE
jgi:RimJ/RimL family protein N-acetyltransferase